MPANKFHQVVLDFPVKTFLGKEDFFIASSNKAAVTLIESLPAGFHAALLYGSKGSGKTHLSHLFSEIVEEKKNEPAFSMDAKDLNLASVESVLAGKRFVILENIIPTPDQEALFHLINGTKNQNGFLLMTSEKPYGQWGLSLPDLVSRMKAVPSAEILEPDDGLMSAVLVKLFSERQLNVPPEVIAYLLKNMERSFAEAIRLVKAADELSLAEKRPITIPLVRQVLMPLENR